MKLDLDDDVHSASFSLGLLFGIFAGLLLGVMAGALQWRTQAVQTLECKTTLEDVDRAHRACIASLNYERENPKCPQPTESEVSRERKAEAR